MFRRPALLLLLPLALLVLASGAGLAQSGAIKSGLRGRVVVAKKLKEAKVWPVEDDDPWYRTPALVRRPSGHGKLGPAFEPAPELLVVLEGAKEKTAEPRVVEIEGRRFVPSHLLVPKPARLKVYNRDAIAVVIVDGKGAELAAIEPEKSAFVELPEGDSQLSIKGLPYAQAKVRVLEAAIVLPVGENGLVDPVPVEGGAYKLAFYHGAIPLQVQEIQVPDSEYIAFDASISENRVVSVSIKDGGLKAIRNRPPPPPSGEGGDPND